MSWRATKTVLCRRRSFAMLCGHSENKDFRVMLPAGLRPLACHVLYSRPPYKLPGTRHPNVGHSLAGSSSPTASVLTRSSRRHELLSTVNASGHRLVLRAPIPSTHNLANKESHNQVVSLLSSGLPSINYQLNTRAQ